MEHTLPPFKVDIAGTFLVPKPLKDAREQCRNGQITPAALRAIEDEEIRKLVEKLKTLGLKVVTDGNFRSDSWLFDFMCGLDGIQEHPSKKKIIQLTRRIDAHRRHPVIDNFMFLTGITGGDLIAKQVLPAPSLILSRLLKDSPEEINQFYPDIDELFVDLDRIYNRLITKLFNSGCRYIQFDDTTRVVTDDAIRLNNRILEQIPAEMFVAFHAPGDMLISTTRADAFFLDYDDECCSRYKLMWFVREKRATFGFIPSHYPLEDELDDFRSKIEEIRRYIPLNRFTLCIPNATMLPSETQEVAEMKQWRTFDMAKRVAEKLWPQPVEQLEHS